MRTADEVVETLVRLKAQDRDWVLERLSPEHRSRLAAELDGGSGAQQTLESASSGAIAALLKKEPAWLIHAVLQAHRWPWEPAALAGLSSETRYEVNQLKKTAAKVPDAVVEALLRIAVEKLGVTPERPTPSRFEIVLERVRRTAVRKPLFGLGRRA